MDNIDNLVENTLRGAYNCPCTAQKKAHPAELRMRFSALFGCQLSIFRLRINSESVLSCEISSSVCCANSASSVLAFAVAMP